MPAHLKQNNSISIHAPVKGATIIEKVCGVSLDISIHAPVKGATAAEIAALAAVYVAFQFTLP